MKLLTSPIGRIALLALAAALLTLAYAPFGQFYLAWIGLVPWLVVVRSSRTSLRAFGWGWIGALIFNLINFSWLWGATRTGMIGLACYLSLFWGLAALVIARTRDLRAIAAVPLIAVIWTGCEWFRGWLFTGFPWMFLGQTQTPVLAMCQVADITGVFGVSFWLACVSALAALHVEQPARRWRALIPASLFTASLLLSVLGYGIWRIGQTSDVIRPGPRVMVVQPNHPHLPGGAKSVTWQEQEQFHFETTRAALRDRQVDLVVWSETVLPPMNAEARQMTRDPRLSTGIHEDLLALCRQHNTAIVFGAYALLKFEGTGATADVRNSTYFYTPDAEQARYDKIHLVPFSEILPFKQSVPWLYHLLWRFAAYAVDYPITGATESNQTLSVFTLRPDCRIVTPICFEDADGRLIARMFRPLRDGDGGRKRAEVLVNVTNDGWFRGAEKWQHFQSAIFRSIENRVPTARADNTGISGFVDSVGRVDRSALMVEGMSGTSDRQVMLDSRVTIYTRIGDVFGAGCFIVAIVTFFALAIRPFAYRSRPASTMPLEVTS
jgi:apolipoprotein N-acyltransferase